MFGFRKKIADSAKRAGLLTGGLLLCAVGTGFLTVAGWLALVPVVGIQTTALIVAAVYIGLGLILMGVGSSSPDRTRERSEPDRATQPTGAPDAPPMMQAFMYGLQAGAMAEKSRH